MSSTTTINLTLAEEEAVTGEEAAITTQLRGLFPKSCSVAVCEVIERLTLEFGDLELTQRFSRARRNQFLAGRLAARTALIKLGCRYPHVAVGEHREPLWPSGTIGSIAHIDDFAVSVAARREDISGVGIDLETVGFLNTEMWPHIFNPQEISRFQAVSPREQALLTTVAFGAKEAFFKLQFPHTGRWVDFEEADVTIQDNVCRVRMAEPFKIGGRWSQEFTGAYRSTPSNVLVGLWSTC